MALLTRRAFAAFAACACLPAAALAQAPDAAPRFVCPPCGCGNDGKVFDKPGVCSDPACGMTLVAAPVETPPKPSTRADGR